MTANDRLSMATHITKLSGSCFYYIYNIRRLRKYLSRRRAETLCHLGLTIVTVFFMAFLTIT